MMENDEFEKFENRFNELINANESSVNLIIVLAETIAKETGFSVQFVKYILDSVDIHYSDEKLLRHIVQFTAEKMAKFDKMIPFSEPSATQFKMMSKLCSDLKNDTAFSLGSVATENLDKTVREFPLLTRIAIVATYCASYNAQTSDRLFFFKGKDILKRKPPRVGGPEDQWHRSGPRPFDHQRAMFIFLFFCKQFDEKFLPRDSTPFAVCDNLFDSDANCGSSVDFTSQVAHLVEQGLLQVISASENLDMPKYRSLCSLSFVEMIARSISPDFNLKKFLLDFASEN